MFKIDRIAFSPRKIYWFGMPSTVTNDIKLELLKKDILIINCSGKLKNIQHIIKTKRKHTVYIFNIDGIVLENEDIKKNKCILVRKVIEKIGDHVPEKSFVYTKTKDCKIDFYCNKAQIKHKINDIFENKANIVSNIILYIFPIFKKREEQNRNFLRLVFFPYILYEIEFPKIKSKDSRTIKGYLKDLSFNGISIILFKNNELSFFNIGSKIQINLIFDNDKKISINDAIIIRKYPKKKLLCLSFDINDRKIINKKNSDELNEIIFKYIKNFYINMEDQL